MSLFSDFFEGLFGVFINALKRFAESLFMTAANVVVEELGEALPMAARWAKEAVEAAEAAGGDGSDKWKAAKDTFVSKATTEGYQWSNTAIDTLLQNTVAVATRESQALADEVKNLKFPSPE